MSNVRGGDLIAKVFKQEGVKYIFGIPGGHIYPMMEACDDLGIKFIGTRNEMNAAFMAEGWALTTGKVGVCCGTAGPGFTNLITGIANASCNKVPILAIGGKARTSQFDRNDLQDFQQLPVVSSFVKYARQCPDGYRLPEYFGRAIAEALNNCPGPVYMEVPREKMEATDYDLDKVNFQKTWVCPTKPAADPKAVQEAAQMIKDAKAPIIIAGSGAFFSGAGDELTELVNRCDIPIFTRNAGRGIVPDTNPHAICIGSSIHPVCKAAIDNSDLIIICGTRSGYTLPKASIPSDKPILRIDIDGASITDQFDIKLGLVGDVKTVLNQLLPLLPEMKHPEWMGILRQTMMGMSGMMADAAKSPQVPIHPIRLMAEIRQFIDKDTIMVIDGGDTASWGNLLLPAMGPGQTLTIANGSFGPLGVGMPYAIAAKLAHPEKKVILLTGDGAFGYGAMEYDTCMRYGIKITTVILNDACWGMIKNSEAKKAKEGKPFVGLYLRETHYEEVVKGLGGYAELVTKSEDIHGAIERALNSDLPSLVNVMTDVKIGFNF